MMNFKAVLLALVVGLSALSACGFADESREDRARRLRRELSELKQMQRSIRTRIERLQHQLQQLEANHDSETGRPADWEPMQDGVPLLQKPANSSPLLFPIEVERAMMGDGVRRSSSPRLRQAPVPQGLSPQGKR